MKVNVNVSNDVLFLMVNEALESYAIKHDKNHIVAIESHAQLWGSFTLDKHLNCDIKHFSVDSSASKKRGSVLPKEESLALKKDIAHVFGEGFEHLGSFHTHPYINSEVENAKELRKAKLYDFSDGDYQCEIENPIFEVDGKQFSLAIVMTMFAGKKADDRSDGYVKENIREFSLGNIKLWLNVQVYEHKYNEDITEDEWDLIDTVVPLEIVENGCGLIPVPVKTELNSKFLKNLDHYLKKFGRLEITSRKARYTTADVAETRELAS